MGEQIIVKTYIGKEAEATISFQADASLMAAQGYFPVFQSWAPGQWQSRSFIKVLLLSFLIVGIPALVYMLIVTPDGALTVTYVGSRGDLTLERRARPAALSQHLAQGDATGGGQGPDSETAPLTLVDQR